MATKEWKCHTCGVIEKEAKFRTSDGHVCPVCKSEDAFPYRVFQCMGCGFEAEQGAFFADKHGEADLDPDPGKEGWKLESCNNPRTLVYLGRWPEQTCTSRRYKQVR